MRLLIVSDAWFPQVNGVVNTLAQTARWMERFGHEVRVVSPRAFRTFACPTYPEIRLSLAPYRKLAQRIRQFQPHAIHIATEGPLGFAARRYCVRHGLKFTTSYHTQFPQYLRSRVPVPLTVSYAILRWFHSAAERCLVSTATVRDQLAARGFRNLATWQRGVDTDLYRPQPTLFDRLRGPVAGYLGRLAVEKNVDAFLGMEWHGSKVIIGDGPERARLEARYPDAVFAGFKFGEDLARHLASLDVFVFPSRTDTFGLVMLEAMACGVPVAAFPVTGPIDVVRDGVTGVLDEDLAAAARRALELDDAACRAHALDNGWDRCTREFENQLAINHAHTAPQRRTAPLKQRASNS